MSDEELDRLLIDADSGEADGGGCAVDLAQRVRLVAESRRRRQRAGRITASACLLAGCALAGAWAWTTGQRGAGPGPTPSRPEPLVQRSPVPGPVPGPVPVPGPDEAALLAELASARREAAAAELRAARLLAAREGARAGPAPRPRADPVVAERDRAALILVHQGDALRGRWDGPDAREYRRVLELFPRTPWAEVARRRLTEMRESGQGSDGVPVGGAHPAGARA